MPKQFCRFAPLLLMCCTSSVLAQSPLCPKPVIEKKAPKLVADQKVFHEAMEKARQSAEHLDWVDDPNADNPCGGSYVIPPNPNPQQDLPVKDAKSYISADAVQQNPDGSYQLSGDAELYRGPLQLSCDAMIYNPTTSEATLKGNVQIRNSEAFIRAAEASFTNELGDGKIDDARYVFYRFDLQGDAKKMEYDGGDNDLIYLHDASLSTCPPKKKETWKIDASEIQLNQETEWGKAFNSIIRIKDVPVFYIPYMDFPLSDKRKTGFLYPAISISGDEGFDLQVPYYLNIAPNFDVTLSPRFNTEHGLLHSAESRYLNSWSEWQLNGSYIVDDRRIDRMNASESPHIDRNRWIYSLLEQGNFDENWSSYINYARVSDIYFLRDWGDRGLDIQKTRNIKRTGRISYDSINWQFDVEAVDYQPLRERVTLGDNDIITDRELIEEYKQLPRIDTEYISTHGPFELEPIFLGQAVYFEHTNDVDAIRSHLAPGLGFPLAWQEVEINPQFIYKRTDFRFSDNKDINDPDRPEFRRYEDIQTTGKAHISVPTFSLDNTVFLEAERETHIQTLNPRLFYYYAAYQDQDHLPDFDTTELFFNYQQLFRGERFSSYDRIGDANQMTLALDTQWLGINDGRAIADIGIGQIFYFEDRRVALRPQSREFLPTKSTDELTLTPAQIERNRLANEQIERRYYNSASDIAAQANWYIDDVNSLRFDITYDPFNNRIQTGALTYQWLKTDDDISIVNVGYRYRFGLPRLYDNNERLYNSSISETNVSIIMPVARDWSAIALWHFDLAHRENIEHIVGIKYEGCCASVTFAYQRERDTSDERSVEDFFNAEFNTRWFIEFELKGLGAITSTISRLFAEKIQGYPKP
ncbi:LPS-assembly protein LptD [BD1-7 clade bacterium]|uniref:LPS-assembly protein LptD n=1 Tax=BD1-7 clade bacterium TaxID=2029982 RepID=A0A5S9QQ88_9GAMM|nr:LPS-assembly protein LptD [BD1-7 clade bacterium]CAA0121388.1 LPS-assembly protein LptD [BD1-7 clade bacterium]